MQLYYQMNLGRLKPSQLSSITKTASLSESQEQEEIVLESALPVLMSDKQALNLLLVNPLSVEVHNSILQWYPYFVFHYGIDKKAGILGRKRYREDGTVIVDANTGEVIGIRYEEEEEEVQGEDIEEDEYFSFISKQYCKSQDFEKAAEDIEKNHTVEDLINITPKSNYRLDKSSLLEHSYNINKIEPRVPINAAQRMVLDEIVEDTKAKYHEVQLKKGSLIYVPKWIIEIQTINGSKSYRGEVLAASKTVIINEIALCPKDALARIRRSNKPTYAVCERCGNAYCKNHIVKIRNSYYCKDCK